MQEKKSDFYMIPKEILSFFKDVFEIYEIRVKVGETKQIKFIVHTNDHNPPHIHAKYDKYEISISLLDFSVLAGNIPLKNKNIAIKWVKEHGKDIIYTTEKMSLNKNVLNKKYLFDCWENKTLISGLPLTNSNLDFKETIKS